MRRICRVLGLVFAVWVWVLRPACADEDAFRAAIRTGDRNRVSRMLATNAAALKRADPTGRTALHWTAERGDGRLLRLLLDHGADVAARDAHGNTPLHLAAKAGQAAAVALLLDRGADARAPTLCNYTPLHLAAWSGNAKTIKLLLARGADVHAHDYDHRTPLHYASTRGAVVALVKAGAEVNARYNPWSRTPLLDAARHGFPDAVAALLDHGANLRAADDSHFTALHWAAWAGHTEVVRLLLRRGADPLYLDDSDHPAIFWAELRGHAAVARLLKKVMRRAPHPVPVKDPTPWG